MNPNYIGWSIVDWRSSSSYSIVKEGIISIKELNDYDNKQKINCTDRTHISNFRRHAILEICKNEDVQDKLAYWKYVCLPEIRANLTEHQNLVKFAFFNSKLGTTLYSVYDTKDKLKHIKNIKDYEQI